MTMNDLPEGWDTYDPNNHERSSQPAYIAARATAAKRAERRRTAYGEALAALRRARSLTQVALAKQLRVAQGEVSRIEHQTDLLLSTLVRYVDGMDGELSLVVHFGDDETIELSLVLDELAYEIQSAVASVEPDPITVIELAGYLGRYQYKEEKFRAAATA
jgi:transcriptional regulator with XRE-family HTH domain